jgi:flagellar hook-associated protein 1 FlgK
VNRLSSLSTTLFNAANAMQVYERAFNVIENNITNANTPGYVTQDQSLVAQPFNPAEGISGGVTAGPMISARSQYLEQAVRNQQEALGSSQQTAADLGQLQPQFNTTGASGVPGALSSFFNSVSQLSVSPNDQSSRQDVIAAAGQVASAFNQNATGIQQASANVNSETSGAVTNINQIAADIAAVNGEYSSNSAETQDAGLDARLNNDLESLSQLVNYTAIKNSNGTVSVYAGGQTPLVLGSNSYSLSADFSQPQTAIRASQGNDITGELNGTGGSLGAMLEEKNTTLPGYMSSLNNLAQAFSDQVNQALAQGVDINGNPPAVNLFSYNAAQGAAFTMAVTGITPDQIAAASAGAPGGNGNAIAIEQMANQTSVNGYTFTEAYGNLGAQVGQDVATAQQNQTAQQNLLTQATQARASASGVDLNVEAAQLLQFQQAYQAAGQLITTINNLNDTLINMMTVTQ